MENLQNFRMLAEGLFNKDGYKLKDNMIYRFGLTEEINEIQIKYLESLNFKYIYDLRNVKKKVKTSTISLKNELTRNI